MDAIVGDISAFRYWRIPPLVRLLVSGSEDDALLQSIVTEEGLTRLRQGCAQLPLVRELRAVSPRWRAAGLQSRAVREGAAVLGVGMGEPVDVLITRREQSRRSTHIRPRLWSPGIPGSGVAPIANELGVLLPEYSLLQLASRASLVRTVLLATELCGSFSVYDAPACVREVLQTLANEKRLPKLNGWSPCLDNEGQITTEERVVALSRAVADKRGVAWRPPTERERELGRRMRSEVLGDWSTLPDV